MELSLGMEKKFELLSNTENLVLFRKDLKLLLASSGLDEKRMHDVTLAVDEALANVIRHGYDTPSGKIEVFFRDFDDRIEILIRDFGRSFDPTQMPAPELPPRKPGGLGIYFIRTVMDKVEYCRGIKNANELLLTKHKVP